jgi:tetratricopeptide (TPR) repeat protein
LNDARAAATKPPPPPPPPPLPDYNKSMQTAQAHDRLKQWADSAAAYRDALKARPGDKAAIYGVDMAEGQRSLDARRYDDAVKWFEDALRQFPNDAYAKALLQRAKDKK